MTVVSVRSKMSFRLFGKEIEVLPFGSTTTRREIPEELIVEILLLLPVVILLRFRCVSRKWRNLIDSPGFVKSHLDHAKKAHSTIFFVGKPNAYCLDLDSVCYATPHCYPMLKELANPSLEKSKGFCVLGPCNGLFCIQRNSGTYCLWNPSTRKYSHVPQIPVRQDEHVTSSCGLGYDHNSNDYKLVCPTLSKKRKYGSTTSAIWIYSFKSGLWKSLGESPYDIHYPEKDVFVNGALHWAVHRHLEPKVNLVAFDLGKSEWNLVPLPEYGGKEIKKHLRFGVLDGCLYAIYHEPASYAFDLWVMKEYGVKESWTKLIAFPSYTSIMTPLTYVEAGNELIFAAGNEYPYLDGSNTVVWYEFETKSFKRIFYPNKPYLHTPCVYIPSLVCPLSVSYAALY